MESGLLSTEDRVGRGASLLDEYRPGWERLVDLTKLDLADTCNCVLGQVFFDALNTEDYIYTDGFEAGVNILFRPPTWDDPELDNSTLTTGFDAHDASDFGLLREAWTNLIKCRFNSGGLSGNDNKN